MKSRPSPKPRFRFYNFEQLQAESARFEARHNGTWRYTKLRGLTPETAVNLRATKPHEGADRPGARIARPRRSAADRSLVSRTAVETVRVMG